MNDEMTLACGVTLHLQPVQVTILQDLMMEFGDMALIRQPERILQLQGKQQVKALAATNKLFTYCAGWGVTNEPPAEDDELMVLLGRDMDAERPHLRRANWIRTIANKAEYGALIGQVMAITTRKEEAPAADTAVADQAARIAELEAQLAAAQNGHVEETAVPQPGADG